MKIHPVSRYKAPDYPTMTEARLDPSLLERIPSRWGRAPGFAAALGVLTGVATRLALTANAAVGAQDEKAVSTLAPAAPRTASDPRNAGRQVQQAASLVAPLLDEALKYDGRGSFGCVAINPPTFLSESEALELIRTELTAAGLKLKEQVELSGVEAPTTDRWGRKLGNPGDDDADEESDASPRGGGPLGVGKSPKLGRRTYAFDLADTDRSIYIEYLSARDHTDWQGHSMSTVASYDFPALAQKVSKAFQKHTADKPAVFGVFFDPLAHTEMLQPQVSGLSDAQQRLVVIEQAKAQSNDRVHLDEKAKEKLRKQVRNFVTYLRQSGVVAKAK
jgi:hypothetical protein